jgi:hypothetical protein
MPLDPRRMADLVEPYSTVSDRIRALDAAGVPRAEIARFLGKRYQHVRNVLQDDVQSGGYTLGRADLSGVRETASGFDRTEDEAAFVERRSPGAYWLRVRPDGSVLLPSEVAEALRAAPGERVFARFDGGELKLVSADTAMQQARDLVRQLIPPEVDMVSDLLATRRAETAADRGDG